MQAFRDLIKGWLGKVLLGVVVIIFGAFGTESLLSIATRAKPAAQVNGEPIEQHAVERLMEMQRQNLRARMGENLDPELLEADNLRPRVIDALVERELLKQYAATEGFGVSELAIQNMIVGMPQFQEGGKFSAELYQRFVQRMGFNPEQFQAELSSDFIIGQLRSSLTQSAFVTDAELNELTLLEKQSRSFEYLVIDHRTFLDEIEVEESALVEYYDANQSEYMQQEQGKFSYFEVAVADYLENAKTEVTEEAIAAAYEADKAGLVEKEERQAAHILIEVDQSGATDDSDEKPTTAAEAKTRIEAVAERIAAGEDFAALAKELSEDVGSAESGGDLGFAKRGDFVEPFEEALYALEEGQVSEIVKTEFGFHIIKLLAVKEAELPPLEQERDRLADRLALDIAEEKYLDAVDALKNIVFTAGDIEGPAETVGKSVQQSDWVSSDATMNSGVFVEPAVLAAAFSPEVIKDEYNSEVIELSANKSLVLRSLEYQPEEVKSFSDVKPMVLETVKRAQAIEKAADLGRSVVAKLRTGAKKEDVVELVSGYVKDNATQPKADDNAEAENAAANVWRSEAGVGRFSATVDREIVEALFKLPKPTQDNERLIGSATIADEDFAVMLLNGVEVPTVESVQSDAAMLARFISYQLGQLEYANFVNQHKLEAEVEVN